MYFQWLKKDQTEVFYRSFL